MLTTWFTASFPSKVTPPSFRYKQTSTNTINSGSPVLDGQGYVIGANLAYHNLGSAVYINYTFDPTKGDTFAFSFTRTVNPDGGTSSNVYYGNDTIIVNCFFLNGNLFFNGQQYPVAALTANKIDIAYALNYTTKTVRLYATTVVGAPKTFIAEKPFSNIVAGNNGLRVYMDNSPSSATNIKAYNTTDFAGL